MAYSRGDEPARRRHRALADPSRGRILAELADGGRLDTRELARRVGLHTNTVRAHLVVLAEAGLVAAETLPPHGRGRPRRAFRAAADASPEDGGTRRYRLLAEILATFVAHRGDDAHELEAIGAAWGGHLVDSPRPGERLSDAEAVERVLVLLAETGFQPRLETAGGRRILMRPCPFLEVARRHREVVCPIHLGLIRGALTELDATTRTTRLEPFAGPDACVARLSHGPR